MDGDGGGVGYGKNVGMLTDIELHCYSLVVASSSSKME